MTNRGGIARKTREEVENLVDEVVLTIDNGVTHSDGSPGFAAHEIERLRSDLREYAAAILTAASRAARGRSAEVPEAGIDAAVAAVVETIRRGVLEPAASPGFGPEQAEQLRASLRGFGDAIVTASGEAGSHEIYASVDEVVRSVRSGLFLVYGRGPYAAISGDQLEAYLQTFADAALAVVERETADGAGKPAFG